MTLPAKPIIAYQNLFAQGTQAASSAAPGYPVENIADFRNYTLWKSQSETDPCVQVELTAPAPVDCLALVNHNSHAAGVDSISVLYDDSGWQTAHEWTPANDAAAFRLFNPVTSDKFRVVFNSSSPVAVQAGIIMLGRALQFPVYPEDGFDPDGQEKNISPQYSRSGQLLGVALEFTQRRIRADFRNLIPAFIADEFLPFFTGHVPKPFVWAWDATGHPQEIYWMALADADLDMPCRSLYRSLSLSLKGAAA